MTMTIRQTTSERVHRPEFDIRMLYDWRSERIKVISYRYTDERVLTAFLAETARSHGMGKVVLSAGSDWPVFLAQGFSLEGMVKRFYNGSTGHYMAYYLSAERQASSRIAEEQDLLLKVLDEPPAPAGPVPEEYAVEEVGTEAIHELADVYDQVFATYPSPLTDPEYIRELIGSGEGIFMVARKDGRIASAAAAEIDWEHSNAEITNCATLPDFRGEGLMAVLIGALQERMRGEQVGCLYSMARARSFGMNLVLKRAGYEFRGRLINHAHIGGGFEDLNLWERPT